MAFDATGGRFGAALLFLACLAASPTHADSSTRRPGRRPVWRSGTSCIGVILT